MRFLYIHGFASGPQSRKAQAFRSALAERGIELDVPALDEGDFEHLTISGQLGVIERALDGQPGRLIGSSMGGYLAALYAGRHAEVDRLALMAPAFGFAQRWKEKAAAGQDLEVFHYGDKAVRSVHYGLIEDALLYPATPDFSAPCRIYHGVHDDVVPIENSRDFARTHGNAVLAELDSDHELLNVLQDIVADAVPYLNA
jgi:pimeloyl-ACP methyl ester carboxylesterase